MEEKVRKTNNSKKAKIKNKFFTFFNAIFNVADAAISIGVMIMIFFNKTLFPKKTN